MKHEPARTVRLVAAEAAAAAAVGAIKKGAGLRFPIKRGAGGSGLRCPSAPGSVQETITGLSYYLGSFALPGLSPTYLHRRAVGCSCRAATAVSRSFADTRLRV